MIGTVIVAVFPTVPIQHEIGQQSARIVSARKAIGIVSIMQNRKYLAIQYSGI